MTAPEDGADRVLNSRHVTRPLSMRALVPLSVLLTALILFCTGCGYRGPLYLPQSKPQAKAPPPPAPAAPPERPTPSEAVPTPK